MEITTALEEKLLRTAAPDPAAVLDGMVSNLQSLEAAIASLHAIREQTLAMASRLAEVMVADDGAQPGSRGALRWDSVELAQRAVAAEIAAATRMSDRTVQRQMDQAVELLDRFPATFQALAHGRISLAHVRVIQDAGTPLDGPAALARYESVVVACAERQAPNRLRRVAVREAEKAQPEPLVDRHERAAAERCVRVTALPDGMAELAAILPAAVAHGIHDRLTQMAKTHADLAAAEAGPAPEVSRSIDQLRADLFADMLLRGAPPGHDTPGGLLAAITARVDVTVPVLTLIGGTATRATDGLGAGKLDAAPAELSGRHPIDPGTAQLLAGHATAWNRVLTDPISGAVLAVERYRPGEDLKRLLTARDSRCRFPGCGIKARDLDLDHTQDAALGGTAETGNLAGLCRRHHVLKHHSPWTVRQKGNGTLEWTSPTGRKHTDHPPIPATSTVEPAPGRAANSPPF